MLVLTGDVELYHTLGPKLIRDLRSWIIARGLVSIRCHATCKMLREERRGEDEYSVDKSFYFKSSTTIVALSRCV